MSYRAQQPGDITSNEEIHWYLQDLAMMPVLSLKEEQDVIQQIAVAPHSAEATAARTLLIEANLRLVVRVARRYQPFGPELADLVQEGNLALVKAAQQFDPQQSNGHYFRTFAAQRVCWALYRVVEEHLQERHLLEADSMPLRPLSTKVLKALAHNAMDEQALVLDLPTERFVSLDALLDEGDTDNDAADGRSSGCICCTGESDITNPHESYLAQECRVWVAACLQNLTTKERLVLIHRYLLDRVQTLEEVGRVLGVSRERVRQLEERGIRKLRHPHSSHILRSLL
ncbi:MAG: hypothetical protein NVSMB27_03430 [Ktedonobacteraceae bacterium]